MVFPEFAKLFLPICAHAHLFPWFDRQRHLCRIFLAVLSWKAARNRRIRVTCRSGGIGRRAWFRSMYPQGCGGSSPFFGTILLVLNHLPPWCPVWCPKKPGLVSAWCPIFIPGLRTPTGARADRLRELHRGRRIPPCRALAFSVSDASTCSRKSQSAESLNAVSGKRFLLDNRHSVKLNFRHHEWCRCRDTSLLCPRGHLSAESPSPSQDIGRSVP